MPIGRDEILHRFGSHPPNVVTSQKHDKVREGYISFAEFLDMVLPDGRTKTLVFDRLQETAMWSNFAIAETIPAADPSRRYKVSGDLVDNPPHATDRQRDAR